MAAKTNEFIPDYAVAPGAIIQEYLEAFRMTPADLVQWSGLSSKTVAALLEGTVPITAEIAARLELALGRPARFWRNLERQFRKDSARLAGSKGGGQ